MGKCGWKWWLRVAGRRKGKTKREGMELEEGGHAKGEYSSYFYPSSREGFRAVRKRKKKGGGRKRNVCGSKVDLGLKPKKQ